MSHTEDPVAEAVIAEAVMDAPKEPAFAPQPVAPQIRRASPVWLLAGGILAALIGFGLSVLVPKGWPVTDTSALEAALQAETAETQALKAQVGQLAEAPKPAADPELSNRLTAVETALTAAQSQDPVARLTALEDRLTAIEALPKDGSAGSGAALAALQADVTALKSAGPSTDAVRQAAAAIDDKVKAAEAQFAALQDAASAATRSNALHEIAAALDSGAPFSAALAELGSADLPKSLTDTAQSGVPSLQSLRASFPDAARAALGAALKANMGSSWTDRVSAFLRNESGARSLTPRDGADPDAVLSRAEAALAAGDLAKTLTELSALPPEGQAAMASWQADCTKRVNAQTDVAALLATSGG